MSSELETVIRKASKLVEPTTKDVNRIDGIAEKAIELVKQESRNYPKVVDVIFGGSYAKNTWLKDDVDIDIFVRVSTDATEDEFETIGRTMGMDALKAYKPYLRYSEHPYVEAIVKGVRVNVVPCYDVKDKQWRSAADRSPYHTELVKQRLDEIGKKESRLLKKFMMATGTYGSEIATAGFSGYVCEVLILRYDSCVGVMKAASEFDEQEIISIEGFNEDLVKLFKSSLIIIDPVDERRNLGTAISDESVGRFILASRHFLEKPNIKFFKGMSRRKVDRKVTDNMIVIKFNYKIRSPDIIWGQLKSSVKSIAKQLSIVGYKVVRYSTSTDERGNAAFIFLFETLELPRFIVRHGPKVFDGGDSNKFIEKNSKKSRLVWVGEDVRLQALIDNKFSDASSFITFLLTKEIDTSGVSSGIMKDLRKNFTIYAGKKINGIREKFVKEALSEIATTDRFAIG